MNNNFLPYEQALKLKELGFDEECFQFYMHSNLLTSNLVHLNHINEDLFAKAPLYQQAFKFFRDKYNFLYSIGKTNVSVYHIPVANYHSTFMLQDNASYEMAELETIKAFIEHAKSINL